MVINEDGSYLCVTGKVCNDEEAAAFLASIANLRELIAAMRRNIENQARKHTARARIWPARGYL